MMVTMKRILKKILYVFLVLGILGYLIYGPYLLAFYPGITRKETVDLLIAKQRGGGWGALWKAKLHGDSILGPLVEATDNFSRLYGSNVWRITDLLISIKSPASRALLEDLFSRDVAMQKLVGAVGLASDNSYPEKIDENAFLVKVIRMNLIKLNPVMDEIEMALWAMEIIKSPDAVPFIDEILSDRCTGCEQIQLSACKTLAIIHSPAAIEPLRKYMVDGGVVPTAFRALISLGDKQAVPLAINRIMPENQKSIARPSEYLARQLTIVTGKDFGTDKREWELWWASAESQWQVPSKFIDVPYVEQKF